MKFRNVSVDATYTQFEDRPAFEEVAVIADRLMGRVHFRTHGSIGSCLTPSSLASQSRSLFQKHCCRSRNPLEVTPAEGNAAGGAGGNADYEFLPSAGSILEEVVPASFRVKLFKCFLDRRGQRTDRAYGCDEECDRERWRHHQTTFENLQPSTPIAELLKRSWKSSAASKPSKTSEPRRCPEPTLTRRASEGRVTSPKR